MLHRSTGHHYKLLHYVCSLLVTFFFKTLLCPQLLFWNATRSYVEKCLLVWHFLNLLLNRSFWKTKRLRSKICLHHLCILVPCTHPKRQQAMMLSKDSWPLNTWILEKHSRTWNLFCPLSYSMKLQERFQTHWRLILAYKLTPWQIHTSN